MKILYIVSWYSPYHEAKMNAGIFHNEQARELQKSCEVSIWFPFDKTISHNFTSETEWGVRTYRTKAPQSIHEIMRESVKRFTQIQEEFKPDIIHAHVACDAGIVGIIVGKRFRIPVVVTEHAPIQLMHLESRKSRMKHWLIYHMSNMNVCVSNDLAEKLSRRFPNVDFLTIYNGVLDPWMFLDDNSKKRKKTNLASIDGIIIASFYNKEIKGFQYLLPALKNIIKKTSINFHLHICGDGEYLVHYKQMAYDLGIINYCSFYGNCDKKELYNIVTKMDFGISASLFESAGVAVEELLLLGKPVVVTRSGGASSLVSNNNAIIVEPGSSEELEKGILKMCNSYTKYDNELIRKEALEKFEIMSITRKYIEIYKRIMDRS